MLDHGRNILTRHLPKTGQVTSYAAGDDGEHEAGWWRGRLNSNNRQRFIEKTISGDQVVIDRATGLMWPKNWSGPGGDNGTKRNWASAVSFGNGLSFAGFSDWRLPNANEYCSIFEYAGTSPFVWSVFTNVYTDDYYWTSTTRPNLTTDAYVAVTTNPSIGYTGAKTALRHVIAVRDTAL